MRARGLRRGALALLVAAATGGAVLVPRVAGIGAAYYAKTLCSGLFVAQRTEQDLLAADLVVDELWPLQGVAATVDHAAARIDARFLAIGKAYAVHRPGYGCELNGRTEGAAPQGSSVSGPWPNPTRRVLHAPGPS
jgi:hypothetical protein